MLLRRSGIRDLSEVQHPYYERCGELSVFKYEKGNIKTSILPEDIEAIDTFGREK